MAADWILCPYCEATRNAAASEAEQQTSKPSSTESEPEASAVRKCPAGHDMAPDWDVCPYCETAGDASNPDFAETEGAHFIFISYRRDDSADISGRIYDRLINKFGKLSVFKDVDSIPLGADFREQLSSAVGKCSVVLAIIGRSWLTATTKTGVKRLDDANDYLRIEIQSALQRNIPIIPVLVQGASLPEPDDLPEPLQDLVYRHAIEVRRDPDFHIDMDRLIGGISKYLVSFR